MEYLFVAIVLLSPFLFGFFWGIFKWQLRMWLIRRAQRKAHREAMRAYRKAQGPVSERVERSRVDMAPPPPRGWLIDELIPLGPKPKWKRRGLRFYRVAKGYVTAVLGAGGVGKSYILVMAAVAAVLAREWLGEKIGKCRNVLYVDTELDAETFWLRVFEVCRGLNVPVPEGIHYLRLYASLGSYDGQLEIRRAAKACRAQAIFVDSMTIGSWGVSAGDQNMWRWIYACLEGCGVPIIVIDHLGKDSERGAFGSFMKQAMVRSILLLTQSAEDPGMVNVTQAKTNFGKEHEPFAFRKVFAKGSVHFPRFEGAVAAAELPDTELPEEPDPFRIRVEGWVPNGRREAPAPTPVEDPLALLGGS